MLALGLVLASLGLQARVSEIEVRGNRLVPESTVRHHLGIEEGLPETELAPAFRRLWATGLFVDVRFDTEPVAQGLRLVVSVEEKPLLRETRFTGERIEEGALREALSRARQRLDPHRPLGEDDAREIARAAERVLGPDFEVGARVDPVSDVQVDLVLDVARRIRPRVETLGFRGNVALDDEELSSAMRLAETSFVSRLTRRDRFDRQSLEADLDGLRALYRRRGYPRAIVGPADVRSEPAGEVSILIPVEEGERYRFGPIVVEPGSLLSREEARTFLPRPGETYDGSALDEAVERLTSYYVARGYPAVRVDQEERAGGAGVIDVTLRVDEGPFRRVGLLTFHGHRRHRDRDLREFVDVTESERFDAREVARAVETLMGLGNFVSVTPEVDLDARPGRADVDLHVQEKPIFEYLVGGGLNGTQGGSGSGQLLARGLFRRSETLRLDLDLGDRFRNVAAGYRDVSTLGRRLSLQADFRRAHLEFPDETVEDAIDFAVGAGGPQGSAWRFFAALRFSSFTLESTLEDDVPFLTPFLGARFHTYRAGVALLHEELDRPVFSSRGRVVSIAYELVAGDVELNRLRLEGKKLVPIDGERRHVLALTARAEALWAFGATADRGVPRFERLFLGSENDLRGFPIRGVGPREGAVVVGGDRLLFGSAEYRFSPWRCLRLVGFFDLGNVTATDFEGASLPHLRYDAGAEVQILIPVANLPLRLGYGSNLDRLPDEPRGRFFVSLAVRF